MYRFIVFLFLIVCLIPIKSSAGGNGLFLNGDSFDNFIRSKINFLEGREGDTAFRFDTSRVELTDGNLLTLHDVSTRVHPDISLRYVTFRLTNSSAEKVCARVGGELEGVISLADNDGRDYFPHQTFQAIDATVTDYNPGYLGYNEPLVRPKDGKKKVDPGALIYAVGCRVSDDMSRAYIAWKSAGLLTSDPSQLGEILFELGVELEEDEVGRIVFRVPAQGSAKEFQLRTNSDDNSAKSASGKRAE